MLTDPGLDAVAENFSNWAASGPPDIGVQTSSVLASAAPWESMLRAAGEQFVSTGRGAGNGSLMRTAPVALTYLGDDAKIVSAARRVSDLTHGDLLAGDACVIWCIAVDRVVRTGTLDGLLDGVMLVPSERREYWQDRTQEALTQDPASFGPAHGANNGFVTSALQAALSSIWSTPVPGGTRACEHLQDVLQKAVSIGGDTDTVAAIAGMVVGARWGMSAVSFRWRRLLHGRPGLTAKGLTRLAVRVVRSGSDDPSGWPSSPDLLPYYSQEWPVEAFFVPVESAPGVIMGSVQSLGLLPQEVDAVVSLCRVGASQVRPGVEHLEVLLLDTGDEEKNLNLEFVLRDTADVLADLVAEGKTVLLHCVMGASRTPTVAATYLARSQGISFDEALGVVVKDLPGLDLKDDLLAAARRSVGQE